MITLIKNIIFYGVIALLVVGLFFFLADLFMISKGFQVAVVAGTPSETKAHLFKDISNIRLCDNDQQTLLELSNNTVDVVIADRLVGLYCLKKAGYHQLKSIGDLLERENSAIAFIPEYKSLRQAVNQALQSIIFDGTYARISQKYFGRNIAKKLKRDIAYPNEPLASDSSLQSVQRGRRLRIAVHYETPPFNYYDNNNKLTGFDIEIMEAVCKQLGVEFVPIITAWEGIGEGLRAKYYDGIWGKVTMTSEWLNHEVEFSDPFYTSGPQLFVQNDSSITGVELLEQEGFQNLFSISKTVTFPRLPDIFKR